MRSLIVKQELDCSSIKAFITDYFDKKNAPATYYKNGELQCEKGYNRSLKDLYCLVKSYFNTTIEEVAYHLISMVKDEHSSINGLYCDTVGGVIFYSTTHQMYETSFPGLTYYESKGKTGDPNSSWKKKKKGQYSKDDALRMYNSYAQKLENNN